MQVLSYRGVEVTRLSAEDLRELFAIRIALERLAVAEADGKVSDAELGGLRRIPRRMDRTRGRDASWTTLNTSFHGFVRPIGNGFGRNPCASGLAAPAFLPTAAVRPPEESRQQKRVRGAQPDKPIPCYPPSRARSLPPTPSEVDGACVGSAGIGSRARRAGPMTRPETDDRHRATWRLASSFPAATGHVSIRQARPKLTMPMHQNPEAGTLRLLPLPTGAAPYGSGSAVEVCCGLGRLSRAAAATRRRGCTPHRPPGSRSSSRRAAAAGSGSPRPPG